MTLIDWLGFRCFGPPSAVSKLPLLEKMATKQTGSEMFAAVNVPVGFQPALARIATSFRAARADGTRTLRSVVERLWFQMGGAEAYESPDTMTNAERYLDLLETCTVGSVDAEEVWTRASQLYASQQSTDADVEVMTIHRSKGLEFQHVVIPDLNHGSPSTPRELLLWRELSDKLLIATKGESGENTLYEWLRAQNREEDASENKRLLYVATTRAIQSLSLFASLSEDDDKPTPGSLYAALQPHMKRENVEILDAKKVENAGETVAFAKPVLTRLKSDYVWNSPQAFPDLHESMLESPRKLSASEVAPIGARVEIAIGNLVHCALYEIGRNPHHSYINEERKNLWRAQLRHEGLAVREVEWAVSSAVKHIQNVLKDPDGRWILFGKHGDSGFERRYTVIHDGRQTDVVLDRTFVDGVGTRWIIDYKTAERGADAIDLIRAHDEGYERQLRLYAETLSTMESRPIRAALYFTSVPALVEYPLRLD